MNWTDDWKSKFGYLNQNDGIFFISIEDFHKEYESTTVCFVDDSLNYEWISHTYFRYGNLSTFSLVKANPINISVAQVHQWMTSNKSKYKPFICYFAMFKVLKSGELKYKFHDLSVG